MRTFDNESFIFQYYRIISKNKIKCFGRFFHCLRIKLLTHSKIFSKTWKDSSSKNDLPPDFYNKKHRIVMEIMRMDDCVDNIDGKRVRNSFEKTNLFMKKHAGKDYKKTLNGDLIFIPDTRNSKEFNFQGYVNNFERVILKHSNKVEEYQKNYPKCKTTVFLVCDESNNYVQVYNNEDLKKENERDVELEKFLPHMAYCDKKFIEIIKNCKADYLIWLFRYKSMCVNGKEILQPRVCIYDIKHLKIKGRTYNHNMMLKVKEEVNLSDIK